MITFESVSKSYGSVRALRDLSFEIAPGEVFGYIGPNGAGKTTTIKILAGLVKEYRGDVLIHGTNLRDGDGQMHRRIGYLPQDVGFQEWRTVEHALQTFGLLSGIDHAELESAIDRALERTGIAEHRKRRIVHLSGGTVQRLRLAQSILHDPEILILDEPLSGLDPASRFQVKEIITELADRKRLVFVSSHILSELEGMATRIGILHEGQIREMGTPEEMRKRHQVDTVVEVVTATGPRVNWEQIGGSAASRVESADPSIARFHVAQTMDLDGAIREIMGRLLEHSVPVRSIRHLQPSLEELYLQLTGGRES